MTDSQLQALLNGNKANESGNFKYYCGTAVQFVPQNYK
jgi:hypothetical protein